MKGLFFIWVGRIIVLLFVAFLIISAVAFFAKPGTPPSVEKAPWVIQTYTNDEFRIPSRFYYAESIEYVDGTPVAKGKWWSYDGKNYRQHKGDMAFPPVDYGIIDLIKREAK